MSQNREQWGSKLGFILAATGSAVGIGNIWKYPSIAGQNGGGAFTLVYLVCIFIVGLSIVVAEFVIGRKTQLSPVGAFEKLAPNSNWKWVGFLGVASAFVILSFYGVVGGWILKYIIDSISGGFSNLSGNPEVAGAVFDSFVTSSFSPILYQVLFMGFCIFVIVQGVKGGIEKWSKIMMPLIVVLLAVLAVRGMTLAGGMKGISFLFNPRFEDLTASAIVLALGHSFFTVSLGMGTMITYGSYLSDKENLTSSTVYVVMFDTMIALLVGMVIFPAVFAMGLEPTEGPSLVFSVLPTVFTSMPMGQVVSVIFFTLLAIAAITSGISLLEVVVAYFIDQRGWERKKTVMIVGFGIFMFGVPSGLSFGVMSDFKLMNMTFFDHVDNVASNYLLPLGGMLTAIFVGWIWGTKNASEEIKKEENVFGFPWVQCWEFLIRYITPVAVGIVFLAKVLP